MKPKLKLAVVIGLIWLGCYILMCLPFTWYWLAAFVTLPVLGIATVFMKDT